jgi:hypothetical protein
MVKQNVSFLTITSEKPKGKIFKMYGLRNVKKGEVYGLEVVMVSEKEIRFNFKKI